MFKGRTVFAQMLDFVPFKHFEYLVEKFAANHWSKTLPAWSHFVCLAYAQITRREGLRDLVACLNCHRSKLYHLGIRHRISRSTLADASERRNWQLFESLGQHLIAQALVLHQTDAPPLGLKEPLYAMDSTVIDLCLALFPWAYFRQGKAAIKAHTVIDLRGCIYGVIHGVEMAFLTNRWDLPALSIAQIYKERWKIELFFKWLKQNLSIKHFFGNSINAVKSQIWIAVCVYLVALIAHKTLKLEVSLQLFLHLVEVNMFEKIPIKELVKLALSVEPDQALDTQMELL